MANRREVIQGSIALSAVSVAGLSARASEAAPTAATRVEAPPLRLDGLVFDSSFAVATEVADSAARYGTPLFEMRGDTTEVWYHHLRKLWRGPHAAVAGITNDDAMFVFETLAADHRMRAIYRGVHEIPAGGVVAHVLSGPAPTVDTALGGAREPWAQQLGQVLTHCASGGAVRTISRTTDAERPAGRSATLISWILAPNSWGMTAVDLRRVKRCGGMV